MVSKIKCCVYATSLFMGICCIYCIEKAGEKFNREYYFVKNNTLGIILGAWCFVFTAFACIGGMYSTDMFKLVLNIVTPFVLIGLGVIMPYLAKRIMLSNL